MIRHALAEALRLDSASVEATERLETVDVEGAAILLHCSPRAIYVRNQRGQMPKPVRGAKRLVWRKADLLGSGK